MFVERKLIRILFWLYKGRSIVYAHFQLSREHNNLASEASVSFCLIIPQFPNMNDVDEFHSEIEWSHGYLLIFSSFQSQPYSRLVVTRR